MDTLIVRNQVIETLSKIPGMPGVLMGKIPQKPETKQVIEYAIQEAKSQSSHYVGTEHLLFGIAKLNDTEPAASLIKRRLDYETIHDHRYSKQGKFRSVDGTKSEEEVFDAIRKALPIQA
jgi:ATP-dependent Clp protease ATP-binding subunit ClpA